MRIVLFCCLISIGLSSCRTPPLFRKQSWIDETNVDINKRYYVNNGVSFLPPSIPGFRSTVWNYQVAFNSYSNTPLSVTSEVVISAGTASTQGNYASKAAYESYREDQIHNENRRRADILAGTLEDQWQKELSKGGIEAMMEGRLIYREGSNYPSPFKSVYKTPKAQEEKLKDNFYFFFARKRARLQGLPNNTYQTITVNGRQCLQTDIYERLGTPLGEYAVRTGGGIEHSRGYSCYIRPGLVPGIYIDTKLAAGDSVDFDKILAPILESFDVDESLPANQTTFQMMTAPKKIATVWHSLVLTHFYCIAKLRDTSISPHSSYKCSGDFCDNKQPGSGGHP